MKAEKVANVAAASQAAAGAGCALWLLIFVVLPMLVFAVLLTLSAMGVLE